MYVSPAVFESEFAHVFQKNWACIGHRSQVPKHGDVMPFAMMKQQPLFVANTKGKLKAFHNVCRHRGAKLVSKPGRHNMISCPYHKVCGTHVLRAFACAIARPLSFHTSSALPLSSDLSSDQLLSAHFPHGGLAPAHHRFVSTVGLRFGWTAHGHPLLGGGQAGQNLGAGPT